MHPRDKQVQKDPQLAEFWKYEHTPNDDVQTDNRQSQDRPLTFFWICISTGC